MDMVELQSELKPKSKSRSNYDVRFVSPIREGKGHQGKPRRKRRDDGSFKPENPEPAETAEKPTSSFNIVLVDHAETAVEYRRKGGYEQHNDDSKPRKLPRLSTQDNPILWQFTETLGIRVSELKTQYPPSLRQYLDEIDSEVFKMEEQHGSADVDTSAARDTTDAIALAVRISSLEELKQITYNFKRDMKANGRFACPVMGCTVDYGVASRLKRHWRSTHESTGTIVAGKVCYPCGRPFKNTRQLILHEKNDHGEEYDVRIEPYLAFFKQSHSTKDFKDLLPPAPEVSPPTNNNFDLYDSDAVFDDPNFLSTLEPVDSADSMYSTFGQAGETSLMNNQTNSFDLYDTSRLFDNPHFPLMVEPVGQADKTQPAYDQAGETSSINNQTDSFDLYDTSRSFDNPHIPLMVEPVGQVDKTHPTYDQKCLLSIDPAPMLQVDALKAELRDTKDSFDELELENLRLKAKVKELQMELKTKGVPPN